MDYGALIDEETAAKPTAEGGGNPYAAILESEDNDRVTKRKQNILGALDTTPDRFAMARQIEKHLAIPAPVVERNYAEVERKYRMSQMDHAMRNNPELEKQMEDPVFAKLAQDRLVEFGDLLKGTGQLKELKRSRLEQSGDAIQGGFAKARQSVTVMAQQLGLYKNADAEFATRLAEQDRVAQRYNAAPDVQAGLQRISEAKTMGEALQTILEEPYAVLETSLRSLGSSSPALLAAIGGSVFGPWGTATGAGAGSFAVEFSNTIGDVLQERGVDFRDAYALSKAFNDPEIMGAAREKAAKRGIAIGAFDALTAGMAGKLLAGARPTLMSIAPRVVGEFAMQGAGGMAGEATAQAVTGEYKPGEILMEGFAELPTGIVEVRGNWRHARDAAVKRMTGEATSAAHAKLNEQQLTAMIDGAAQEPMLKSAPDVFVKALNDAAAEGQDVSNVYLNARQLTGVFNQDPIKAAEALGIDAETLDAALASDSDVSVSVGEFIAAVASDESMRPLVEHAKLGIDEMSPAEAREWDTNNGEAFRQEAESIISKRTSESEFAQSAQQVEDFVFNELQSAGRFTDSVNKADAALHKAFAVTMADRLGMQPMDFFKQHVLRVQGESVAGDQFDQPPAYTREQLLELIGNADTINIDAANAEHGITEDEAGFLSNVPAGTRFTHSTRLLGRVRRTSEAITHELGGSAEAERTDGGRLGAFTGYQIRGEIVQPDEFYNPNGALKVQVYGKEQADAGLLEEPALTFTVMPDGELSVNGPTPGGETFKQFQARGWADQAKAGDQIAEGWTALKNPDGGNIPMSQVLPLLADVHARVRAWKGEEKTGLYWSRATGASAGLGDYGAAVFFQPIRATSRDGNIGSVTSDNSPRQEDGNSGPDGVQIAVDEVTGLPLNKDGTVTLYHHTSAAKAEQISKTGTLKASAEPDVYVTTRKETDTGYGDTAVAIRINPDQLTIDDEFPDGRKDFRLSVGKPGGSIKVSVQNESSASAGSGVLEQGNRGSFNPDTNTIALLQNADLSTFLHESGHYFLEVMTSVAGQVDAPVQIKQDVAALLDWFGIKDTPQLSAFDQWALMPLEEKRQHHEQFARGFEAYLMEGKAPNIELQGLFSRFRAWLINVYKSLSQLNVALTDDVRAVMDRMIATDEQIAVSEAARRFAPIFQTQEESGMTAEVWATYQGEHQQATDDAAADLQSRSIRDMRWLSNAKLRKIAELQKTSKALRAEAEMSVRREVMGQPVYQAWAFLTGKTEKAKAKAKADPKALDPLNDSLFVAIAKLGGINKTEIVQTWGTDPADIKNIGRPVFGMPIVRANEGKRIDELVQALGDYGYLPLDQNDKADVRDLEDFFAAELRGDLQYSMQKDYSEEMAQDRPPAEFDLENYPHGKFDADAVRAFYGSDNLIADHLEALNMLGKEGYEPDEVASNFGFTSGDDLMRTLAVAESPESIIAAMTDQKMLEEHGDLSDAAAIERAAEKAIHNDVRARFLTRELNALRTATGKANILLKAARGFAEQRISGLKVRDAVKPAQHQSAEARSGKAAAEAAKAGNIEAAATHKRDQVLNHELARASLRAGDEVTGIVKFMKRFDNAATRKALDKDYRDQIDALLERFDFRKSVSDKELEKRKSLAGWIEKQTDMGLDPAIDQRLIDNTKLRHYRELTLEELRGLHDTIANIEHLGRLKNQLLTAQRNRNLAAVAAEIAASIHEFGKGRSASAPIGEPHGWSAAVELGKKFAAEHRKLASMARQMDGGKSGGAMWEYFIRSMNEAGNREAELRATASERLSDLFDQIKHIKTTRKEQVLPGVSLTRENMLVMALNWGNEGNRQRLMDGGLTTETKHLTQAQVESILDRLSKAEWDFVQGVWNMLELNRPAIAAQEVRLTGVEPKWVEPASIVTRHGTYAGGYYPAKYDGNFSTRSNELEAITDLRQQMLGAGNRAQTRKGYTQERANAVVGRPLKLAFSTLTQHVNEVAHRLAWQDWLIDANRLLKRGEIDDAIREHYGPNILGQIRETVRDIATGDVAASSAMERSLNHIRTGATIAGLGWNMTTSLLQPFGLTQSIVRIGWAPVARGLRSYLAHPLRTIETVEAKSSFMANRGMTMNREINDVLNRVRSDKMSRIEGSYFYMIQTMQKVADMPTWMGEYEKQLAAGEAESRAIALADQSVLDSQGSGTLKDLARIQRGGPALKLFTNFYSFFNTLYNLAVERGRATDYSNPMSVGKLAVDYLLLFVVPSVMVTLLKHGLRGGDDDEEKLLKKIGSEQLNYIFGSMVLVREIGGAVTSNFGYEGPASLRLFSALQKMTQQVEQGEVDVALVKSVINVAGVVGIPGVGQFPSGQINRTIDGVIAVSEGKAGPLAPILGPPLK